jgi:hypothetical protein
MRHNPDRGIMANLVKDRAVKMDLVVKPLAWRDQNVIECRTIAGLRSGVSDRRTRHLDEALGPVVDRNVLGNNRLDRGCETIRKVVDLLDIEDRVAAQIGDRLLVVFAFLRGEGSVFDDEGALFAFADLSTLLGRLTICHPGVFVIAAQLAGQPEHQDIDAAIGFAARAPRDQGTAAVATPWPDPRLGAGFELFDDRVGDALVGIVGLHGRLLSLG